ncbi:DUF5047 domain-containing protein [Streptomyces sp. NPDC020983]|uniref:DUF5047 domain-containing protein n=1 Tax=Streptomyces sp. NPDC020983 TaxID=3365106 RepID=UPI0037AD160A
MSTEALEVVTGSYTMEMRVSSWLGDELLADDIPIADGTETRDRSLAVPEQLTLSVPRRDTGVSWEPVQPTDPLAAYGQQLHVDYGVDVGGHFEWIRRGVFLITDSSADDMTVSVTCEGLLSLINEARLAAPFQPSGTLVSTVRALVEPALTVQVDGALTDRTVPLGLEWDDDRMAALQEVLTAWPAAARVTEDGLLLVEPVTDGTPGSPVLALTDGVGGTVIRWSGATTRDGAFNAVVAQGEDATGAQITGVAYDTDGNSPYRIGGPYSPLMVPYFYSSSLLTTVAQCRAAAATRLTTLRRTASRTLDVTCHPHPGLVPGDIVSVTSADNGLTGALASIETLELPYSPGQMSMTVRMLAGG